jgi:hypothetical protein
MFNIESMLGVALSQRGAEVEILLCDAALPVCLECEHVKFSSVGMQQRLIECGPIDLCKTCHPPATKALQGSVLKRRTYSEVLTDVDRELARSLATDIHVGDIQKYRYKDMAVGEHAYAGTLRFFGRGTLEELELGEAVLRRYLDAALLTAMAVSRLVDEGNYDVVVMNHGIYVPQGIIAEVVRKAGKRVVTWNPGYRKGCFLFSHGDTYHHTMMTEPVDQWNSVLWSDELEQRTMRYLHSRWTGVQDWIWFHDKPFFDVKEIEKEVGVDFSKPCIGMLTNVIWDAQLHYPANAFPTMMDWVLDTVAYFAQRPELQLLIRVHPAEVSGGVPSRQRVVDEVAKRFNPLPPNVFIIPPESHVSTYAAMMQCDSVLIFGTKTGIELTSVGIPVVVAGEAWIRNKGLTIDVTSRDAYRDHLDRLPLERGLSKDEIKLARKYAFHFFFRRMIPLNVMSPVPGWTMFKLNVERAEDLGPGLDPGLDIICDGIIDNRPFIYPLELEFSGEPEVAQVATIT